jgi:branched-chain amino acid transport system permease protein
MDMFVLNILNGISFGMVLFLISAGFSLVFGVMGILNLAHGALYMVGAYIGWSVAIKLGLNFGLAVLAGGIVAGLVGLFIERMFLRHLYKQLDEQVLLTFGFVYILTNLCIWIWGPFFKSPFTAPFLLGSFNLGDLSFPKARIFIILIGTILTVGLWWLQSKTRVGAIIRAGMDNKETTMALGINLELVFSAVFFLGAFIAGFAGVLGAQILGVNPMLGIDTLLLAFIVVIVGGVGSVQGSLLGGVLIGLTDAFGRAYFPELAMFLMYMAMIIMLAIRPSGLLSR